jgi:hypothetical protein
MIVPWPPWSKGRDGTDILQLQSGVLRCSAEILKTPGADSLVEPMVGKFQADRSHCTPVTGMERLSMFQPEYQGVRGSALE